MIRARPEREQCRLLSAETDLWPLRLTIHHSPKVSFCPAVSPETQYYYQVFGSARALLTLLSFAGERTEQLTPDEPAATRHVTACDPRERRESRG